MRWKYKKDGSVSAGSDCGWLDQVVYVPSPSSSNPTAHVEISDILQCVTYVWVGVGDPENPVIEQNIWDGSGGSADNVDLDIELIGFADYWPPLDDRRWYLKVYGSEVMGGGRVDSFYIEYLGDTYTSDDHPTTNPLERCYAWIGGGLPSVSLGEALDNIVLSWTTEGDADWFGQTSTYYYDGDAAQSGDISHNQNSRLQTQFTIVSTTLSFYWKVSSEENYDWLEFYIDDIRRDRISGDVDLAAEELRYRLWSSYAQMGVC